MTVVGYGSVLRRILSVMYRGQLRGQVKNRLMVLMIFPEPTALASTDAESSAISSKAVPSPYIRLYGDRNRPVGQWMRSV